MARYVLLALSHLSLLAACSGDVDIRSGSDEPALPPRESEVVLQAVDAGTGSALADGEMTVRYLVRSPITLTASSVERVPATRPYRIRHRVGRDSLVVEVRLEAPSYHRLDTALSVERGGSSGPHTIRMARRLESGGGGPRPPSRETAAPAAGPPPDGGEASPAVSGPASTEPAAPDAGVDRSAIETGDRAFERGEWSAAVAAYSGMTPPESRSGAYAREYQEALVRLGVSHLRLGDWGAAPESLEEAVSYDSAGYAAYLRLAEARCAAGRTDEGLQTLARIAAARQRMPEGVRRQALLFVQYQRGVCLHRAFEATEGPVPMLRAGSRAIRTLERFIEGSEGLAPAPPPLDSAMTDARSRVEAIKDRLRAAGRG